MNNTTVVFIKTKEGLVPIDEKNREILKLFTKSLINGEEIEVYFAKKTVSDKTLAQLAKVHALIREIADFSGHNFNEIKEEIKKRSGLYTPATKTEPAIYKSFSDCSKTEMSSAIQTCLELGQLFGLILD